MTIIHIEEAIARRRQMPEALAETWELCGSRIDTDQMLATGAIEGPYRRPRAVCAGRGIRNWLRVGYCIGMVTFAMAMLGAAVTVAYFHIIGSVL